MLRQRTFDFVEQQKLFEMMIHPDVYPFVRHKVETLEEFIYLNAQLIEAEQQGELLSRVMFDGEEQPIGTINLFDIHEGKGFLGTWIGKDYQGKGYNQQAKYQFLSEIFMTTPVTTVLLSIRKVNAASQRAAAKLPYVTVANSDALDYFRSINAASEQFELLAIEKENFLQHAFETQSYVMKHTV